MPPYYLMISQILQPELSAVVTGLRRPEDAMQTAQRQIEHLLPAIKSSSAFLTSSCGLEYLPRDRAQLKLKHLKTVKDTFLGSGKGV